MIARRRPSPPGGHWPTGRIICTFLDGDDAVTDAHRRGARRLAGLVARVGTMFEVLPESRRVPSGRASGRTAGATSLAAHALVAAWAATAWSIGPDLGGDDAHERAPAYSVVRYVRVATTVVARTAAVARSRVTRRMPRLRPLADRADPPLAGTPPEIDVATITDAIESVIARPADAARDSGERVEDFAQPASGGRGGLADAIARSVHRGRHGDAIFPTADFPAIPLADNPSPDYPEALLAAGVEGEVRVRFVIDTTGALDPRSVRVVASTDERFTRAVRAVLPRLRFLPAESGGTKVAALSEQSFAFVVVMR